MHSVCCSGVGLNFGLGGGQGVLGGVGQNNIILISYKINKDRIHTYKKLHKLQWANLVNCIYML